MMKYLALTCVTIVSLFHSIVFAQKINFTTPKSFQVGDLLDSNFKKNNIITEFGFGKAGGLFGRIPGGNAGRDIVMNFETSFKIGFFPTKRLQVGWDFSPNFCVSNQGMEGFRWSTGPFLRYYFPFYRVDRKNQLKSPVALYLFFNYYLGQYNPIVLDRPFDSRFTTGFSIGIGFSFKLSRHFILNIEMGPRYDFLASEFESNKIATLFKVSLSYSFPTKAEIAQKKFQKLHR